MRVVALLVVVCGCRVAASSATDAAAVRGDGLPDRVITDGARWLDLSSGAGIADAVLRHDGSSDATDAQSDASTAPPPDAAPADGQNGGGQCALLSLSCVGDERCYPFPFEGAAPGDTRCAFQGVGGPSVPCQSQLECDGTSLCGNPGQPDSVCLQRCSLANPRCPTGFDCTAFFNYDGVGVCR